MSDELDPVIHAPARLRVVVTLATLRDGDDLSFTRLQEMIGLTPGNLITHLRKLEDAGYVTTERNGSGVTARTSVALTHLGRDALERYTAVLRGLLDSATPDTGTGQPVPGTANADTTNPVPGTANGDTGGPVPGRASRPGLPRH
jgi:DNA-binding transcriptional ArsR family regulator